MHPGFSSLLAFALSAVTYRTGMQWNNIPRDQRGSHPMLEEIGVLLILPWTVIREDCQISSAGLQAVDLELCKDSHPLA